MEDKDILERFLSINIDFKNLRTDYNLQKQRLDRIEKDNENYRKLLMELITGKNGKI